VFKKILETICRFGLGILIICSPLLMGGNRDWVWLSFSFLIIAVFILFLISLSFSRTASTFRMGSLLGLIIGILTCLFLLMPNENSITDAAQSNTTFESLLTFDSYKLLELNYANLYNVDFLFVIYIISCVMVLVLAAQYRLRIIRTTFLISIITLSFCLQSIISISEYFLNVDMLNFDRAASTAINGTFINANHLATYQACAISFYCGLLFGALHLAILNSTNNFITVEHVIEVFYKKSTILVLILIGVLVLGAAGSRGAIIALAGSLFIFFLLFFWKSTTKVTKFQLLIVTAVISLLLLNSTAAEKLLNVGIADYRYRRIGEWNISFSIFRSNPITGYGFNSFSKIFSLFRDGSLESNLSFTDSHSSILKLLVEIGLLGTLTVVSFLSWWYFRIIRAIKNRTNVRSKQIPILFGILLSVTTIFLHSIVDFTLSIPSIMFLTLLLMGVGIRLTKKPDSYKIRSRYLSH